MARQVSRSDRGLSPSSQPPHSRQRHNNPSTYRPPGERFAPYPPATQRQAPYTPARFNNSMSPRSTHLFQQGGMRDLTSRSVPLRRPAPRSIRPARQVEWPRQYGPTTLQAWTANASPREDRAQRRLRQRLHQNQNSEMLLPVSIYDGSRGQFHAFQSLLCRGLQYIMLHPHALKQLSNMIPADLPGSPSRFCSLIGLVHLRRYIELVIEHLPSGVNARTWRVIVLDDDVPYVGIDIYLGQPYLETNFGGDLPRVSADDISGREMYLAPEIEDFSAITLQSSSWDMPAPGGHSRAAQFPPRHLEPVIQDWSIPTPQHSQELTRRETMPNSESAPWSNPGYHVPTAGLDPLLYLHVPNETGDFMDQMAMGQSSVLEPSAEDYNGQINDWPRSNSERVE